METNNLSLILIVLAACGSVEATPDAALAGNDAALPGDACVSQAGCSGTTDASQPTDAARIVDAGLGPDAMWVVPIGTWTDGDQLANVNSAQGEYTPTISANGLELYFTRFSQTTLLDIWYAGRSDTGSAFGTPSKIAAVSTGGNEKDVYLSPDGLELYWTVADIALYVSTRGAPTIGAPWSAPTALGFGGGSPSVTEDGLILYYQHNSLLKERRRASKTSPWGAEVVVAWPAAQVWRMVQLSPNGRALLLSSAQSDTFARITYATRETVDDSWSTPTTINELNLWPNRDARWSYSLNEMYFQSVRPPNIGGTDLYRAVLQ
jgi:hypothetical protein